MTLAQTLIQTAATLLEEARKISAPDVTPHDWMFGVNSKGAQWAFMLELFAKEDEERGLTPFDPSLRAGILGLAGGSFFPIGWRTHRRILDAASRGELNGDTPWPGPDGNPFKTSDYLDKSTEEKHAALAFIWGSRLGLMWRAHPDNSLVCPKGEPNPAPDQASV